MGNWRRVLSMILALLLAVSCLAGILPHAFAEETEETTAQIVVEEMMTAEVVSNIVSASADMDLPSDEELFAGYVNQKLYPNTAAPYGTAAGEQLNTSNKAMYHYLKEQAGLVADGKLASTQFHFTKDQLTAMGIKSTWTQEELGVSPLLVPGEDGYYHFTEEADKAIKAAFSEQVNPDILLPALLSDCPYEMYWNFKTYENAIKCGFSYGAEYSEGAWYPYIEECVVGLAVSAPFRDGNNLFAVNTAKTSAASNAASKAQNIIAKYADKSDYEKLLGYKNEICAMVEYDHYAADNDTFSLNSNPWQLINVFDGDSSTKVVCEGYAKAFQYLCDLTTFSGNVTCYNVSGVMAGGTGAGGHMWNIVTIGGQNYLVDVTNSDAGSIGQNGGLFLAGSANGSVLDGYTFLAGGQSIYFDYTPTYDDGTTDTSMIDMWGTGDDSILKLAAEDYDPSAAQKPDEPVEVPNADITGDGSVNEDDAVYLLWYTLMPDMFPIDESLELDLDGAPGITDGDALELLWYALLN